MFIGSIRKKKRVSTLKMQQNIFHAVSQELIDTAKKDFVINDEKVLIAQELKHNACN
jgi:hypothetical protein